MKPQSKRVIEYFKEAVCEKGDMRYLFDNQRTFTFTEAYNTAISVANYLYGLGVREGTLIAFRTTRSIDSAIILFATQFLGATIALMDPHGAIADNMQSCRLDADYVITNERTAPDIASNGGWEILCKGKAHKLTISKQCEAPLFNAEINVSAPAMVIFTSGSTGKSKGVVLSQYNYMNHIRNYSIAGCYYADDVSMEVLPVNHVFGLAVIFMGLYCRYQIFFPETTKADYVAEYIEKYGITRLDGVPSYALAICQEKHKRKFAMSCLRTAVMGGAPVSRGQFDYIEKTLGLTIVPVYGMSECIGITGIDKSASAQVRSSCVGKFLPMCDGKIASDGEICVKAPSVMLGYWNDEEETDKAIDSDGYLHTGDLGYLDNDGCLHVTGRKKDIIIRNGNNLSAVEIEKKILSSGGIIEAAVVGIPDPVTGEMPALAIVTENDADETKIAANLKKVLNKIEMPEQIKTVKNLPLLPSGKVNKEKVRQMFLSEANK